MASFKIPSSKLQVNAPTTPNVSSGAIPINLAISLGNNISQAGSVYDDIKKEQKLIEDQNRFYEIITPKQKEIDIKLREASLLSELTPAENILNSAYEVDVSKENRQVQNLVLTYLNKEKIRNQSDLYKAVMSRAAEKSQQNDTDYLNRNLLNRTSPSPSVRFTANKDFEEFFNNPIIDQKYSPQAKEKLKGDYEVLKTEIIAKTNVKSAPFDILMSQEQILKEYGQVKGSLYLRQAQNKFISDVHQEVLANDKEVDERIFNQVTTFSEFASRINDGLGDPSLGMPSIDDIHDSFDQGDINSGQYDALLDLILNENKVSDESIINMIDNQLIAAKSINEFDDLKSIANSSAEVLKNTNIKDIVTLNKLVDLLKSDPTKQDNYNNFYKQLVINMGDLGGLADTLFGSGGATVFDKIETADAVARYKDYVVGGDDPETAYFKVLSTISQEKIPDVYSPNLRPLNLNIPDIGGAIKKNPDSFFDDKGKELTLKFKNKEINREQFIEDIGRLDLLKDVYETRMRVFKDVGLATQKKEQNQSPIGDMFQEIIKNRSNKN